MLNQQDTGVGGRSRTNVSGAVMPPSVSSCSVQSPSRIAALVGGSGSRAAARYISFPAVQPTGGAAPGATSFP